MILYDLPEPPTANNYWRHAGRNTYLTAEAKAYRLVVRAAYLHHDSYLLRAVAWALTVQFPTEALSVRFAWYRGQRRGDLDNRIKQLLDALSGLAYTDDKQIVHIECTRHDDAVRKGRIDVTIEPALIRYAG